MATERAAVAAKTERVECPYCHSRFSTRKRLVTHSRQAHDKTPPPPYLQRSVMLAIAAVVLIIVAAVIWRIASG